MPGDGEVDLGAGLSCMESGHTSLGITPPMQPNCSSESAPLPLSAVICDPRSRTEISSYEVAMAGLLGWAAVSWGTGVR